MNIKLKKIAISGVGGVGGYYGSMLVEEAHREALGREIYFVARGAHLDAIRQRGLHLTTPTRDLYIHPALATDHPEEIGLVDLIIIATKSYDLESNIRQLLPIIGPKTIILPLLNGANISEQIRAILPNQTVWEGCCYISARRPSPGEVMLERDRELLFFGSQGPQRSLEEQELHALLTEAGVKAHNPDDIMDHIRKKFVMISATATGTSYYNSTVGKTIEEHPAEMKALINELCALYSALGYPMGEDAVEHALERQRIMPADSTSSMHVDYMNGSQTEIENLTGYVVREAERLGVAVPTYAMMYEALTTQSYPPRVRPRSIAESQQQDSRS